MIGLFNRRQRRAGLSKPGYGPGVGGCPHVLARFTTKHDQTSTLVRATFPCVLKPRHAGAHRTTGGKEWT